MTEPFKLTPPDLSEKAIENQILNYLGFVRIFAWKNQSVGIYDPVKKIYRKSHSRYHIKGVSDILGIIAPAGRFLAIEVKKVGGYASKEQKHFIEMITNAGGLAFVARSFKEVEERLKQEGVIK